MKELSLSKLLKLHLVSFIRDVIDIVSKHDTKALHIDATFQILIDKAPAIKLLDVPYNGHYLTKEIAYWNKKCLDYASIITSQMRAFYRLNEEENAENVKIAYPVVTLYLNYLGQNNRPIIHETIAKFFLYLKRNPEVQEALNQLDLTKYLGKLQSAHKAFKITESKRTELTSQRPTIDSKATQKELQHLLRMFFSQIDHYQNAYTELNYAPLISELNVLISKYSAMINRYEAFNKKKAAQVKKAKEDAARVAKVDIAEVDIEPETKEAEENPQRVDNGASVDESEIDDKGIENGIPQQTPSDKQNKKDIPNQNTIDKKKPKRR